MWESVNTHLSEFGALQFTISPKERASHICIYTPKGLVKLQLGLLTIVNKTQFDLIYTRCGTQQIHTY